MRIVPGIDDALVRFDDGFDDRQSHAHAVRLGGEEGIEHLRQRVARDAGAGIGDDQGDVAGFIEFGADSQDALLGRHLLHCFHRIGGKVDQYLLQMRAVAKYVRQIFLQLHVQRGVMPDREIAEQAAAGFDDVVQR